MRTVIEILKDVDKLIDVVCDAIMWRRKYRPVGKW
jgi:hypothetical protein